jgi:ArsR family metal-binding transcriptional regulator
MAKVVVFPDQVSFELGLEVCPASELPVQPLEMPTFCAGLAPPCLVALGNPAQVVERLYSHSVPIAGLVPYYPVRREIPQADPPDQLWKEILSDLRFTSVKPSISDPGRLRIDAAWSASLANLIPIMARFIRGGAYNPAVPILAFEEEHRLLVFSSVSLVISRADDLLDFWIMLRCAIELICSAWDRRHCMAPDLEPRRGIGANEIFKRLPGTNCGICGDGSCMEFAVGIFTGRRRIEECRPLLEERSRPYLESLSWLLNIIDPAGASPRPFRNYGRGPQRTDEQPGVFK